jgi:gliding motility-associated-like protein
MKVKSGFLSVMLSRVALLLVGVAYLGSAQAQVCIAVDGVVHEFCSGIFVDPGGENGDYGNNQSITTTLCPSGGSGSGPQTSIVFTQWNIAPGPGEQLTIHSGSSTAGAVLIVADNSTPLVGQTFTSLDPSGCLTFFWESNAAGVATGWVAEITTGPDAGEAGITSVCSSGAPFALFDILQGTPDVGGQWTDPDGAPHSGTFDPATDQPGDYTYTVTGPAPCPDASAIVSVSVTQARDPGLSASITVCGNVVPFSMRGRLGGIPEAGGVWTNPLGQPHGSSFDPATDQPGTYTYTLIGQAPCANASSTLTIAVVDAPDAGSDAAITLCSDDPEQDLFLALAGVPDPGGSWEGPLGAASAGFDPGSDPDGVYTYTVAGNSPCSDASAQVTVQVNTRPDAGISATVTVCSNNVPLDLRSQLGGSPDPGGTWTGPGGTPVSGTFTPGLSAPGLYTYTVLGLPPCAPALATVEVVVVLAPSPGTNRSIAICSDAVPFSLLAELGGSPDPGGTWVGPNGPQSDSFDPASGVSGAYVYTVPGTTPCSNASATLNITVNRAPLAGSNAQITLCSTDGTLSLFTVLGGDPDVGGTWSDPNSLPSSGMFMPGTAIPGSYRYTVVGLAPCQAAIADVLVSVNTAPVAGVNASIASCSNDAAFDLFDQLGGLPDVGGTWAGPNGPHGAQFIPGTDAPGQYTYTVQGLVPCADASAVVGVSIVEAPDAGVSSSVTVCSNDATFQLSSFLGGTPDPSGSWVAPGGGSHGITFVPGTDVAGTYQYTVVGTAPCANDQSTVEVIVVPAPEPGTNGNLTVCSDASVTNLFLLLNGSPEPGGTWTGPNALAHPGLYLPASDPAGTYTYTVAGNLPCANASATVLVVKVIAPNAGIASSTTVCSSNGPFGLISLLGGSPNGSGQWIDPNSNSVSGTFTPGTSQPGVYTYVVAGTVPCSNDTSQLTVSVNIAPNAGGNGVITVCSSEGPFDLIDVLSGNPDLGGSWTSPQALPDAGVYVPATSVPGGYIYVVPGQTPCLDASAIVVVNENRQPVAGTSASFERCSTDPSVDLFGILGGAPDAGGVWAGPGGPSSGIFQPSTSEQGAYTYTVTGSAPCVPSSAVVTAIVNLAPNAGISGGLSVCSDQAVVDLFDGLGGTPDAVGTWTDVDGTGQLSAQFFSPLGLPAGDYNFTYTVLGTGQCGDVSSSVVVNIVGLLDAGTNGTISVCRTATQVDLFTGLGGTPQPGGLWLDLDGSGALTNQFFNASLVPAGTYSFRYRLTGTVSCASDSSLVTVTVVAQPNAGQSSTVATCSNSSPFNLFTLLGGNPQSGGVWTRNGVPFSGIYNPVLFNGGVFVYTVSGTGPCANATASITVNEVAAPNAGTSSTTSVCSDGGSFNMTLQLGGTPQPGTWSFNGLPHGNLYVPGLDQPGIYVYSVSGQVPCNQAQSTLTVSQVPAPNAGSNASITVCSSSSPVVLNSLLGPGAQAGGSWVGPNGPSSGFYLPGVDEPGDYFYTVAGQSPCVSDVAVVSVFENDSPSAGNSAAITLCAGGPNVNLLTVLGGSPDPTGVWTGPAPSTAPFGGVFVPGTTTPGLYTYTVIGAPPCITVSSTVTVAVNQPQSAGVSNAVAVCSSDPGFPMVDRLLGTPAFSGTWTGPAPSTASSNGFFTPGTTQPGTYTYTVAGQAPCPSVSSTLNVSVAPAANAGSSNSISLCSTAGATNLLPLLGPGAQVGGTWTNPLGVVHSGTFLPALDPSGTYRYTVPGQGLCSSAFALVTVVVNPAPSAGCNGLITICNNALPFQLFSVLNCAPQLNGNWRDPLGAPSTGTFLPGTSLPGVYTYTVNGGAPCANATAQVTVIQNQAPNAGQDGLLTVCTDQAPIQLLASLGGSPGTGGTWTAPDGSPFSGTFVPGVSQAGAYIYAIQALAPCSNDSSVVNVIQNTAPDAGFSAVTLVCSDATPFLLTDRLAGTPDPGGSWTFGGISHSAIFDPAIDGSGTYVYTVTASAPCSAASAQVQITRIAAPLAGVGGSLTACVDDPAIPLVQGLIGPYGTNGTWADDDGIGQLSGSVFNSTDIAPGTYHFTYTVPGTSPCANASATVTVLISEALNAGSDATIAVCESEIVDLFQSLGAEAQPGGAWQDIDGSSALLGGVFNATLVPAGTTWRFRYILGASAQCPSDTGLVAVSVVEGPYAGCDGALSLCTVNAPTQLINALTCGPDAGGFWLDPIGLSHSGVVLPAVDPPGIYKYIIPGVGSCPGDTAQVNVQITQAVNAGNDVSIAFCSTDIPQALFPLLGQNAMTGGAWTFNGNSTTGTYDPANNSPGVYRYRVVGTPPCPNDDAFVTIAEPQAPNAGCNASINLCSGQAPINMRLSLGCSPAAGGTWVGPNGVHSVFFDPASDQPGPYIYIVEGAAPCVNDSATLIVGVTQASIPGQSATVSACLGQTAVDLFPALGPLAQTGGTWTDVSVSGALAGSVFNPSQAGVGQWIFTYSFASNGPCQATSAQVTVNVTTGTSAGADSTVTICGADQAYALFGALAGDPVGGGTWTDQLGTGALLPGGILDASILPAGTVAPYTYTVVDAGCGSVSATVVVTISAFPDPGIGSETTLCVSAAPIDLFAILQGSPDLGGIWTDPQGAVNSGTFVPGTDPQGEYTYTIEGNSACADSSAVVQVIVGEIPVAGTGGNLLACDTVASLDLFTGLGGQPWTGGQWSIVPALPALNNGLLNTIGLAPGSYVFTYEVSDAGCGEASAQVVVDVVGSVVVQDIVRLCYEQDRTYTVSFTITEGDDSTYAVDGLEGTLSDTAPYVFTSAPIFTSVPFEAFVTDRYSCSIVRVAGGTPCDFTSDVFVPESFSPNGDGINDAFIIPGIEGYPSNELVIFNRWGGTMFKGSAYDNSSVFWDGTSADGSYSGTAPAGTYYYVLDLGNGKEPLTGYVYINR